MENLIGCLLSVLVRSSLVLAPPNQHFDKETRQPRISVLKDEEIRSVANPAYELMNKKGV